MSFRARYKISTRTDIITVLPGSRRGEISRMLPVFKDAIEKFSDGIEGIHVVIPTLPHLYDDMVDAVQSWNVPVTVIVGDEKYDVFAASKIAIAASGTVSLELALSKLPTVIAYRMSPVTIWLLRRMLLVPYVSILNIMAEREIMPELLQEKCTVDNLVQHMNDLYTNGRKQTFELSPYVRMLSGETPNSIPSENAARIVMKYLK